jgi:hypothetical protein
MPDERSREKECDHPGTTFDIIPLTDIVVIFPKGDNHESTQLFSQAWSVIGSYSA